MEIEKKVQKSSPKRFYIKTFGCQMNVSDSERMGALLTEKGLVKSDTPEDADVLVVNGCTVREKALHKAYSEIGRFGKIKRTSTSPKVIATGGCVGQLGRKSLFTRFPELDIVFGTDNIDKLPELISKASKTSVLTNVQNPKTSVLTNVQNPSTSIKTKKSTQNIQGVSEESQALRATISSTAFPKESSRIECTEFDDDDLGYTTVTKVFSKKSQAFVNIMKGCNKHCTYCIVPYARGKEKSRKVNEVLEDIRALIKNGVREITLLGQNVNSFGRGNKNLANRQPVSLHNRIGTVGPEEGDENFPQLLRALDSDPLCGDLRRIRFTSSHPMDFSDELVACFAASENGGVSRLVNHLHLAVQSGSENILKKMGRLHKISDYVYQIKKLREVCPDISVTTDIIVGFPGETLQDFNETLKLMDEVEFDQLYAFQYSVRKGTPAANYEEFIDSAEKRRRLNILLQKQKIISHRKNKSLLGKTFEILVEGESKGKQMVEGEFSADGVSIITHSAWTGRTSCNRVVNFITKKCSDKNQNLTGQFVSVRITDSSSVALQGELVTG